ncbi:MAG: succinylglutamate desuccinylase/aspartoacylase family protein [Pseudomonadota bacterium]
MTGVAGLDVDADADGRHVGHLTVPLGEGSWRLPVVVVRGGAGPTTLLTAGVHGNEYEGPIALRRLARDLDPAAVTGRVIVCSCLNPSALAADARCAPEDGVDLNRAFPGDAEGTPTSRLAASIAAHLVPLADAVIDLHTGGSDASYIPSAMIHPLASEAEAARSLAIVKSMLAPAGIVIDESNKGGMFDTFVEAAGKPFLSCEFGGTLTTPQTISITEQSVRNVLIARGHMAGVPETPEWRGERRARLLEAPTQDYHLVAPSAGLFEPLKDCADMVSAGEPVGNVHPLDPFAGPPAAVASPVDGVVFWRTTKGVVERDEIIGMMARDLDAR